MNTSNLAYATMNPMSLLNDESVMLDNDDQNFEDVSDSSSSSSSENEDETQVANKKKKPSEHQSYIKDAVARNKAKSIRAKTLLKKV
jgi:hypothetical protein